MKIYKDITKTAGNTHQVQIYGLPLKLQKGRKIKVKIVTILPDTGERYLSTELFKDI